MALKASQLRHAVELARQGNFHQAAEQLQMSQAGLSRSIQSLEANLGTRLFDRLGSGTAPTVLGRLVVERGDTIVEALDDLEREVRLTLGLEVGSLAIGAGPYPMVLAVMPALGRLLAERPNLRVRAKQHDWLSVTEAVTHHDVDLAIAEISHAKEFDHLETSLIGQHHLYFFARPGHGLLSGEPPSLDDIVRFPIIGTPVPERVASHFSRRDSTTYRTSPNSVLRPSVEVDDLMDAMAVVAGSDALLVAPLTLPQERLEQGRLGVVPWSAPWFKLSYGIIRIRHRSLSPAAQAFVDLVMKEEAATRERERLLAQTWLPTLATGVGPDETGT